MGTVSFKKCRNFRLILVLMLIISVLFSGTAVFAEETAYAGSTSLSAGNGQSQRAEYKEFLEDNYRIDVPDIVTKGYFINAVEKISGVRYSEIDKDADVTGMEKALTNSEALAIAVRAAGMKEFAYTYPKDKIESALLKIGVDYNALKDVSLQWTQEAAAAADCGFLPKAVKLEDAVTEDDATYMLGKVLSFQGKYKNFIGYINDEDIYSKVHNAWNMQSLINAEELRAIVDEVLKSDAVTGYNVKDIRFNSNFDQDLSITYGHSDIKHGIQLIGLLRREGLNAKVQLEPKSSAYIYMKEWGEPGQSPDFQVVQIENGNYIAYSKEYDISFEFDSQEQKNKFQEVILKYAKRNQDAMDGLIAGSWWQPLYYSNIEIKDYLTVTNNYIKKDNFIAQSFSLNEKSESVVQGFKKEDTELEVVTYKFWVNEAFYNYLLGDYK
ncbi:MAG: hypothetical protein APF77_19280 [Clostridia bacterium BRH_c25]|nr:MAG: hypothetical protein APF77_19280 [Clostridia bacterium BRH_c25]